jgi:hypothetical protein
MAESRARKIKNIQKKAKQINATFQKVKGSMSQSDISRASKGIRAATAGVNKINDRNRIVAPSVDATTIGTQPATLPDQVIATSPQIDVAYNNAGLGDVDKSGMFKIPSITASTTAGEGEKAAVDSVNQLGQQIQGYLGISRPDANASENALAEARKQAGVERAQKEYNRYQNQINAITSQRDAQVLGLEGQGRGQTAGFIGGEQARINREAAITALPVQAQLAAAQGNLEQAKELMGQLFTAKSADIQAEQTYKTNLVNSLVSFASASQQTVLQAKLADSAERAKVAQANLLYQRELGLQALTYGQNGLVSGISSLDPKSPTFEQDIAKYTAQLKDPMRELEMEAKRASINASYVSTALNQQQLNDIKAKNQQIQDSIASGNYILDKDQQDIAFKLGKEYVAQSAEFKKQVDAYNRIIASAEDPSAAGDLSLIFNYMKILDPGSTVREGEFATAQNSAGVPDILRAQYNKVSNGQRLADTQRNDFVDRSTKLYNGSLQQQIQLENNTREQAINTYGLPEAAANDIIRDVRATGATSDVVFGLQLNNASDEQLLILRQEGLIQQ